MFEILEGCPMDDVFLCEFEGFISADEKNEAVAAARLAGKRFLAFSAYGAVDDSTVSKYLNKMIKYDLVCIFYGYHRYANCVFKRPNPVMALTVADGVVEVFNRIPIFGFVVIDLGKNIPKFDNAFKILDFPIFLQDCENSNIKELVNGMYFDVDGSHDLFDNVEFSAAENSDIARLKEIDKRMLKTLGRVLKYENKADSMIKFVLSRNV
jgi:hypothetical protein